MSKNVFAWSENQTVYLKVCVAESYKFRVYDKYQHILCSHTNEIFCVSWLGKLLLIKKNIFGCNKDTAEETKTNKKQAKKYTEFKHLHFMSL